MSEERKRRGMSDIVSDIDEAYRVYDESTTGNSWWTRRGKPIYFVSPTKHICHLLKDGSFLGYHYWIVTNGDPMIFLSVSNPQTTESFVYDNYYKFYNVDYAEPSFPASIALCDGINPEKIYKHLIQIKFWRSVYFHGSMTGREDFEEHHYKKPDVDKLEGIAEKLIKIMFNNTPGRAEKTTSIKKDLSDVKECIGDATKDGWKDRALEVLKSVEEKIKSLD